MKSPPQPTEAELSILRVLWDHGPSTVREVMDHLASDKESGYTTVLKFLQIMFQKGLVVRDETRKSHVYTAAIPAEKMRRKLVVSLMDKVFAGSVSQLLMHALGRDTPSAMELKNIRMLLDEAEKRKDAES